jgi:acyl carrier protein
MAGELDDATIVGYVTTVAGAGTDEASLRRHVADALPEHMVPARIRLLERFPVTANGKIDRGGLEAYDRREIPADVPVVPDGTATAVAICVIVQELLDVPRAVPGDNFFELGGHSFLATRLAARLRQRFGVKLGMQIVFGARTLDDLAGEVDAATAAR